MYHNATRMDTIMNVRMVLRIMALLSSGAVLMGLQGCETVGANGNDPVADSLINLHHAIAPAAVNNQLQQGNYNEANRIQARDAMMESMR